ncbi:hypothetical protein [Streptomyces rochei]|uniref:hypothetical protein n=1 Tax=Streptomyces rochei TaxID=1928 RepID=UPI0036CE4711
MIAIIALVLAVLTGLVSNDQDVSVVVIPPKPQHSPAMAEANDWAMYWHEAYEEYEDEFTALFNKLECKRAKNGALMIRRGNKGSYKFAKKG